MGLSRRGIVRGREIKPRDIFPELPEDACWKPFPSDIVR